jgi:hypothetical protein
MENITLLRHGCRKEVFQSAARMRRFGKLPKEAHYPVTLYYSTPTITAVSQKTAFLALFQKKSENSAYCTIFCKIICTALTAAA